MTMEMIAPFSLYIHAASCQDRTVSIFVTSHKYIEEFQAYSCITEKNARIGSVKDVYIE